MSERYVVGDDRARGRGLDAAAAAIARGELVVLPTDTVYGVAADAFAPAAVRRLLRAKGRGREMPPPVLVPDRQTLDALTAELPAAGRRLVEEFWPGPLTVVCREQPSLRWDLGEARGTVAVRMPDNQTALDLLHRTGPLAVSSANRSGEPPATTADQAEDQLGESVAVYLDGGLTAGPEPSTIVDLTAPQPRVLRVGVLDPDRLVAVVPELEEAEPGA